MPKAPIVFLAFANDNSSHLPLLKKESRDTYRALREADRKGFIKVIREESTEIKDLYETLLAFQDRVSIFHYAGHADGEGLFLEEEKGEISGIAKLLGEQKSLQLVFLNGCSTKEQVKHLFDAGVKAVIATSTPIQDRKACEFSIAFYEALANKRSIAQAFKMATGFLSARYGPSAQAEIVSMRSLDFGDKEEETEELPWALYVKDDSSLSYQIPQAQQVGLPKEILQYIGSSFSSNKYIISALDEMVRYNPDISTQMFEQKGKEIIKRDSKDYPELIIKNFPWPIGSQIRLLRIQSNPNQERLQTLISTYIITSQTLYFILLSDIWEQYRSGEIELEGKISLDLKKKDYLSLDFLGQFSEAMKVLPKDAVLYVQELKEFHENLVDESSKLSQAHAFLQKQQKAFLKGKVGEDVEKICIRSEQALAILLKHIGFMARFRMMTVRNISIEKPRFSQRKYQLEMGPLNASEAVHLRLYQDSARRRKSSVGNTHSVILVADEDLMHQGLNLSPFVIDKNTFVQVKKSQTTEMDTEDVAHIFMLGWQDKDKLIYLTVNHSIFVAHENEKGTDQIHTEMKQSDFSEGLNLGDDDFWEDDFGFEEEEEEEHSPKVFEALKHQFDMFLADLQSKI
ncbi:MAG: CHAT domain-containing protein [Bacteroidota bacterium]